MKKSLSLLIILLLFLSFSVVACDSTSGRNNKVYLDTFRHDGQFILPVSVTKASISPDSTKYFRSKMSLTQICESVNNSKTYEAIIRQEYVLVRDLSASHLTYCIIKPISYDNYNYLITNMTCRFHTDNSDSHVGYFLVPLYMISVSIENCIVKSGSEYAFSGTKESLTEFYSNNGYKVTETESGISVEDIKGINYNGTTYFDEVVKHFAIDIGDSVVTFRQNS